MGSVSSRLVRQLETALKQFPSWEENRVSCALGLLNIQLYYGLEPKDLILGEIKDPTSGEIFKSATQLTPRDAELVAKVAGQQKRLDARIQWLAAFSQLRKSTKRQFLNIM